MDPQILAAILAQLAHLDPAEARVIVGLIEKYGPTALGFVEELLAKFHIINKP